MIPGTFELPAFGTPHRRVEWRLDERGLEWTGADGVERWMPFACIRLATLGDVKKSGWRLRLSGPPGAVIIWAGPDAEQTDVAAFSNLAGKLIQGAHAAGCKARFRVNHKASAPDWLWARLGRKVESEQEMLEILPQKLITG